MEASMHCPLCGELERALEARRSEYIQASSLASRSVSSKFAAYMNVEMERALNELQEHRSVCLINANELKPLPVVIQFRKQSEPHRAGVVESVA
jgi:hypothetical protein